MRKRATIIAFVATLLISLTVGIPVNASDSGSIGLTADVTGYSLTVNIVGSGTVQTSALGPYALGEIVILTATPEVGWLFTDWTGDAVGTDLTIEVTMDANKVVDATFKGKIVSINVTPTNIDFGTVYLGTKSGIHDMWANNNGNVRAQISFTVTDGFFADYLTFNNIPYEFMDPVEASVNGAIGYSLRLDLTSATGFEDTFSGTLVVWAEEA